MTAPPAPAPDDLIRRLKLIATGDGENYGAAHGSANPTRWDDSDIERDCGLAATALAARDAEIERLREAMASLRGKNADQADGPAR